MEAANHTGGICREKSVSFSGHRSFKMGGQQSLFRTAGEEHSLEDKLAAALHSLYEDGFRVFLCGMAEGFDLMAGEAVLELKKRFADVSLVAVIPYPEHGARFSPETKALHDHVLKNADRQIYVCPRYSADCYHRRNDLLVDNSSTLVCYFNGSKGGTAYTVRRAVKQALRIINLY